MLPVSLLTVALAAASVLPSAADPRPGMTIRNIVLLHGATMNADSWAPVQAILTDQGFDVTAVEMPLTGLAEDAAAARAVIERQSGPTVLVAHSYGGAVATVAGSNPKVVSLVYVAAFQPDAGESVRSLNARWPLPGHPLDLGDGTMIVDPAHYRADLAADLPEEETARLAASQKPTAFAAFTDIVPVAAWQDKPSVAILTLQDRTIDPRLQRFMFERSGARIVEVEASHLPHLSLPGLVAATIIRAAAAVGEANFNRP